MSFSMQPGTTGINSSQWYQHHSPPQPILVTNTMSAMTAPKRFLHEALPRALTNTLDQTASACIVAGQASHTYHKRLDQGIDQ